MDESGKPSRKNNDNYVLANFCIHESNWMIIDNAVKTIKLQYFPTIDPDDVEFHTYEIIQGKNLYKTMKIKERIQLLDDIYDLISNMACTLIAIYIDKNKLYHNVDAEYWALKLLFERSCIWLDKENTKRISNGKPSERALLLIDSIQYNYDLKIRKKLLPWIRKGTIYQKNKYFIEDPIFVESQYRTMQQLVDAVAYCIRRNYNTTNPKMNKIFNKFFNKINRKFDKDSNGNFLQAGLKFFP